jgi:hypothetical protein
VPSDFQKLPGPDEIRDCFRPKAEAAAQFDGADGHRGGWCDAKQRQCSGDNDGKIGPRRVQLPRLPRLYTPPPNVNLSLARGQSRKIEAGPQDMILDKLDGSARVNPVQHGKEFQRQQLSP